MRIPAYWVGAAGLLVGAGLVFLLPQTALFAVAEGPAVTSAASGERWACPMMDFIGNQPGNCPVCGMKMTKVTVGELSREQQRRMGVRLTTVTEGAARLVVHAYGMVRYDDRTLRVVIPRINGRVVKRHDAARHAGTTVREGEPIVDLYSPEIFALQGELAAAVKLGNQPAVRALTERFQRLNLPDVAQAVLAGRAPVDTVTITSPFGGRVVLALEGEMEVGKEYELPRVGQEVRADSALLRLVDPDAFILGLQVPEARAAWLRVGQPVHLATDDRGELPDVSATLAWLAPELNPELRSREVHVHLRDPKNVLLPGALVRARIETDLGDASPAAGTARAEGEARFVLVPKTAVISTGIRHVAWKVAERQPDGRLRFELAPLALGPRIEDEAGDDLYVVRAGLKAGDEVATQGVFLIDSQAQLAGTPSLLFPGGAVAPSGHVH